MSRTFHTFDLIIAGAGPAGVAALKESLKHTSNVILIDSIPEKRYLAPWTLRQFLRLAQEGQEERAILRSLRRALKEELERLQAELEGIAHYKRSGELKLASPSSVRVDKKLMHARSILLTLPPKTETVEAAGRKILLPDDFQEVQSLPEKVSIHPPLHPQAGALYDALTALGLRPRYHVQAEQVGEDCALWLLPGEKPDISPFAPEKLKLPLSEGGMPPLTGTRRQVKGAPVYLAEGGSEEAGLRTLRDILAHLS